MYAYRTFFETELNYNWGCKNTFLKSSGYLKDGPADKVDSNENTGFTTRVGLYKKSNVVELIAPLHCDLFTSDRLMISNTQIHVELHRNSDKFALMCFAAAACPEYKIEVLDMTWYVKKMQLSPSVHLGIETALMKMPAKYPLRRVAMTKQQVGVGRQNTSTSSIFDGQIPRRVIIGFVDTDSYFGDYKKSPFVFKNNNVKEIAVHAGGQVFPREPLKLDFKNDFFSRAYMHLFDTLGLCDENTDNFITGSDFKHFMCFFAFDLTPDESDSNHWELIREGTTSVHCTFAEAIKEPGVEMIVYAEFDNLAMIDRNRTVYFDYSV